MMFQHDNENSGKKIRSVTFIVSVEKLLSQITLEDKKVPGIKCAFIILIPEKKNWEKDI